VTPTTRAAAIKTVFIYSFLCQIADDLVRLDCRMM
jgi:hypothetical protein